MSATVVSDRDQLAESANVGVSAVVLILATAISSYQIHKFKKHPIYPQAQELCNVIFAMPILIGWTSWVNLIIYIRILELPIAIYKGIAVICFIKYIDRMIGWDLQNGKNVYSQQKRNQVILQMAQVHHACKCISPTPLNTIQQAIKYRKRIVTYVYQFPLVILIVGVLSVIFFFANEKLFDADGGNQASVWLWFTIVNSLSSIIALSTLVDYAHFAAEIPQLTDLAIVNKFLLLKFAMFVTQLQPIIINVVATQGLIVSDSKYTHEEITAYTNSLLLCSQMIIVGCMQIQIFPLSDYRTPEFRKSLSGRGSGDYRFMINEDGIQVGNQKLNVFR